MQHSLDFFPRKKGMPCPSGLGQAIVNKERTFFKGLAFFSETRYNVSTLEAGVLKRPLKKLDKDVTVYYGKKAI